SDDGLARHHADVRWDRSVSDPRELSWQRPHPHSAADAARCTARENVERVQPAQIQLCSSTSATTLSTLRPSQIAPAVTRLSVARDPASTHRSLLLGAGRRV